MAKLKLKKETFLKLLINPIFIISFVIFLNSFLFIYIKTSKNLTAKCYQQNKERPQKKACERYQNLSKDKKNAMILSWTLPKSLRRWKTKTCWV